MTRSHVLTTLSLVAALSAALFTAPASAQRASLGERVAALEAQASNNQGNVDLLNQLTALRNEVQALRGHIEELQQQNDQLQTSARNQYLDLDDRMNRLEGGTGAAPAPGATAPPGATRPATTRPAASAASPSTATDDSAPIVFGDAGLLANAVDERSAYELAFAAMKEGRYADSANLFQAFLRSYPSGSYAPNALYWLGESYYVTSNYALALEQFQTVLQRYPTHDKAAGALLKVGLSQYGLRDLPAAEATLGQVVAQHPGTDAARTAEDRLRSIQLNSLR